MNIYYLSIGSSCNVCEEDDERRAAVLRYPVTYITKTTATTTTVERIGKVDSAAEEVYVEGVRNAVGLTFRPGTSELWLTNCERTWLGDELPPESIYKIEKSSDLGWPECHGGDIIDPEFGDKDACHGIIKPVVELPAHVKPLGLAFYTGDQFPAEYQGDLFVVLSGSWSCSSLRGYELVRIPINEQGEPGEPETFVSGWLRPEQTKVGRPVDVIIGTDGSLFISDDANGYIYKLSYVGDK